MYSDAHYWTEHHISLTVEYSKNLDSNISIPSTAWSRNVTATSNIWICNVPQMYSSLTFFIHLLSSNHFAILSKLISSSQEFWISLGTGSEYSVCTTVLSTLRAERLVLSTKSATIRNTISIYCKSWPFNVPFTPVFVKSVFKFDDRYSLRKSTSRLDILHSLSKSKSIKLHNRRTGSFSCKKDSFPVPYLFFSKSCLQKNICYHILFQARAQFKIQIMKNFNCEKEVHLW